MDRVINFFVENFPSWTAIYIGGPAGIVWASSWLWLAGYLKKICGLRTGYTRKIFRFAVFFSVALVQWLWGTSAVCLFGGMTSLVVLFAIVRGRGHVMYEAMAREKDEPHRTHYIIVRMSQRCWEGCVPTFGSNRLLSSEFW